MRRKTSSCRPLWLRNIRLGREIPTLHALHPAWICRASYPRTSRPRWTDWKLPRNCYGSWIDRSPMGGMVRNPKISSKISWRRIWTFSRACRTDPASPKPFSPFWCKLTVLATSTSPNTISITSYPTSKCAKDTHLRFQSSRKTRYRRPKLFTTEINGHCFFVKNTPNIASSST